MDAPLKLLVSIQGGFVIQLSASEAPHTVPDNGIAWSSGQNSRAGVVA